MVRTVPKAGGWIGEGEAGIRENRQLLALLTVDETAAWGDYDTRGHTAVQWQS